MNFSIFWRLVWKEYRLQRALWIAMAALTSLLMLLVYTFVTDALELARALSTIALVFPALYAMGCGAMLFAGEHEAGTYEFERALPVRARRVFFAKSSLAIFSTAGLLGLMWCLSAFLGNWQLSNWRELPAAWAAIGFFAVELLVWTIFVSLLTTRVVLAAILGVAAASIGAYIMVVLANPSAVGMTMGMYMCALPWRIAVVGVVALVDVWLGCRWFRERGAWRFGRAGQEKSASVTAVATDRSFRSPSRAAIRGRLVWQHWRQSAWLLIALAALILPLSIAGLDESIRALLGLRRSGLPLKDVFFGIGIILAIFAAPLFGLCAFHPDQWNRSYRFLAERGVSPKYIWLSRQSAAWGLPMCLAIAFLLIVFLFGLFLLPSPLSQSDVALERLVRAPAVGNFMAFAFAAIFIFGYVILGISVGQFCSMALRSGILAGVFCVLLTALLVGWSQLMILWGINWLWSVFPMPVALMLATRLRTPGWLLERNTLRAWLRPALVLIVPIAAIFTAVPLYRAYEFPAVDPGFSLDENERTMTAEEKATLALYEQAFEKRMPLKRKSAEPVTTRETRSIGPIKLSSEEAAWVDANRGAIELAMEASRGKLLLLPADARKAGKISYFADLLLYSGARLQKDGQLDEALQRYLAVMRIASQLRGPWWSYPTPNMIERKVYVQLLDWSTAAGQTSELIASAVRDIQSLTADLPAGQEMIKVEYLRVHKALAGDLTAVTRTNMAGQVERIPTLTIVWLHVPWEQTRALRLLNLLTRSGLDKLSRAEAAARRGERIPQPASPRQDYRETPYAIRRTIHAPPIEYAIQADSLVRQFIAMETVRRATRLIMALQAWKLDHGSLPTKLDELTGKYLDRLPVDPYSGQAFRYFPQGLPIPLSWSQPWGMGLSYESDSERAGLIPDSTPFIWSTGVKVGAQEHHPGSFAASTILDHYGIHTNVGARWDTMIRPLSEYDVWEAGWPFAIK